MAGIRILTEEHAGRKYRRQSECVLIGDMCGSTGHYVARCAA